MYPSLPIDKRISPRAWFRHSPQVYVGCGERIYTARCLNISSSGMALTFEVGIGDVKVGECFEAFMISRREQAMLLGSVVRTQSVDEGKTLVCISFNGTPEGIVGLINLALSCIDEDFSAGAFCATPNKLKASGILGSYLIEDIRHFSNHCEKLDMSEVRKVETGGLSKLLRTYSGNRLKLLGCRPEVANLVHETLGDSLCDDECKRQCSQNISMSVKSIH